MKKIKLTLISVALCFSVNLFAQQVTIDEARQAASVAMYMFGKDKSIENIEKSISKINTVIEKGNTLMYELIFNDKSSMLVSGNKNCEPILAYNETFKKSLFNENIGCCLKAYIDDFKFNIDRCFIGIIKNDSNVMEWNNMLKAYKATGGESNHHINVNDVNVRVAPLLTSRWGQSGPNDNDKVCTPAYNYYVTETNSNSCADCINNKCPTGCVATAMAQILYYWKYAKGKNFDWCNMPDTLISATYKNFRDTVIYTPSPNWSASTYEICDTIPNIYYEQQRNAIAYLMRQCGLDVGMDYCDGGKCISAAYTYDADNVFRDYGYSQAYWRLVGVRKVLKNKMRNNLNNGYPIQFAIKNHSIVCDGYGYQISNSDHLFHFNWGWTDSNDDFNKLWITISNLDGTDVYKGAVLDIYPDDDFDYCNYNVTVTLPLQAAVPKYPTNLTAYFNPNASSLLNSINSGQNIEYVAHNSIILKPGFWAKAGSNLTAKIEPCANCPAGSRHAPSAAPPKPDYLFSETEIEEDNTVAIYPNPTTGIVNISVSANTEIINQRV